MKAKISKITPVGEIEDSIEFQIPFIKDDTYLIKLNDGTVVKGEPMKQSRYLLEIGNYRYWVRKNGDIELINDIWC
jgi:hypothetical protein